MKDVMLFMEQGFAAMHTRMDKTDESVNERFDAAQKVTQGLATEMNERFDGVNERIDDVNERLDVQQEHAEGLAAHMDKRFDALMPGVASKDFVERKAEAQSTKTHVLVNILKGKNVLTPQEATDVIRA